MSRTAEDEAISTQSCARLQCVISLLQTTPKCRGRDQRDHGKQTTQTRTTKHHQWRCNSAQRSKRRTTAVEAAHPRCVHRHAGVEACSKKQGRATTPKTTPAPTYDAPHCLIHCTTVHWHSHVPAHGAPRNGVRGTQSWVRRYNCSRRLMVTPRRRWLVEVITAAQEGLPGKLADACKAPQLRRFEVHPHVSF